MIRQFFIVIALLLFPSIALALQPLSEDELYDTSGQAGPTVTIQYNDDLTVDYFNQNVVITIPDSQEPVSVSLDKLYYGQKKENGTNFVTLVWPEPLRLEIEFDKYQYFPNGIKVDVSDIVRTDDNGRISAQKEDPKYPAPTTLPPNTTILRTKPGPVWINTIDNTHIISLVGEDPTNPDLPDFIAAAESRNQLISLYSRSRQRVEIIGYVYVWGHN